MTTRYWVAAAIGTVAFLTVPLTTADAAGRRMKGARPVVERDCRPFNGPSGFQGNPWCDGGWKFAEDYPPGTSPHFDVFDLPQVERLRRRWRGE
ncbi:hypothetical protein [Hyphomicrobium sp.]|uniref:hypothetical protein n=1 Tax=Hyphomicrobium sp. TaxID=82 RepID=UPI002FDFBE85